MRFLRLILLVLWIFATALLPHNRERRRNCKPNVFFSVPPADAPELAPRGEYAVGVRTVEVKNPGQIDILNFNKARAKLRFTIAR